MTSNQQIRLQRIQNQHIGSNRLKTPNELANHMGAIQAQDLASAKWAMAIRLPGIAMEAIETSINACEIVRTHILRPTWHIVSATDYFPLLKLTAPNIIKSLKSRHQSLELDEKFFNKSTPLLEQMLSNETHLTRFDITNKIADVIPHMDSARINHLLLRAELDGIICSGKIQNGQHTFALTSERLPPPGIFDKEGTMKMLAQKYFASHGPATIADYNWWSGLPMVDCRKSVDMIKSQLDSITIDSKELWFLKGTGNVEVESSELVYLLPAFDEFLISYKDRSLVITSEAHKKAVSINGVFRPVIVYKGKVIGIWSRALKKDKLQITTHFFAPQSSKVHKLVSRASEKFAGYYH